jgi:hypothetical protein
MTKRVVRSNLFERVMVAMATMKRIEFFLERLKERGGASLFNRGSASFQEGFLRSPWRPRKKFLERLIEIHQREARRGRELSFFQGRHGDPLNF